MNRIRLLSEQVANQIAAGEVVERPASVVKELVENALDADATRIIVEVQAGGRSLIRITDDGFGMSRDDALLCLERHATSKIRKAEDLAVIGTLGFRGEALPSIASVSRFVLTTRERDTQSPESTQVIVNGGRLVEVKAAGAATGTAIEVRQLFFNLPARKKFLRTEETEFTHIQHYLTLASLAHPHVGFTLIKDGQTSLELPPGKRTSTPEIAFAAVSDRLQSLLGESSSFLKVDFLGRLSESAVPRSTDPEAHADLGSNELRVWGYIGKPGISRSTRDQHFLFVNRRPVENRGMNFALLEGYHTALMKGRYPVCCLFLEIDPARVDVNIHPTKREVKFHQELEIRRSVSEAVRQTLLRFHRSDPPGQAPNVPSAVSLPPPGASTYVQSPNESLQLSEAAVPSVSEPSGVSRSEELNLALPPSTTTTQGTLKPGVPQSMPPTPLPAAGIPPASGDGVFSPPVESNRTSTSGSGVFVKSPSPSVSPAAGSSPALLASPLRILGVGGRLYVVMENQKGLVLMDQHAAHERVLYEQMLQRLEHGQAPSQRLLLPETVELSARDSALVLELLPTLTRLGVGLSEFGERTFLLDGVPPFVKVPDARQFVIGLIDELKAAGPDVNALRLGEHTVAKTVCRYAVKANDPLRGPEIEGLLHDLQQCQMPYTCPHGRPTLIELSFQELEKRFGRTQ